MFDNNNFRYDVLKCNFDCDDLRTLQETVFCIFSEYVPVQKKAITICNSKLNFENHLTSKCGKVIGKINALGHIANICL